MYACMCTHGHTAETISGLTAKAQGAPVDTVDRTQQVLTAGSCECSGDHVCVHDVIVFTCTCLVCV